MIIIIMVSLGLWVVVLALFCFCFDERSAKLKAELERIAAKSETLTNELYWLRSKIDCLEEGSGHDLVFIKPLQLTPESSVKYLYRCKKCGSGKAYEWEELTPEQWDFISRKMEKAATSKHNNPGEAGEARPGSCP